MAMKLTKIFRCFSAESSIVKKIKSRIGEDTKIEVVDLSGGCGTMLKIKVLSPTFNGKSMIEQHRLVSDCLKDEYLHGFRLETFPL